MALRALKTYHVLDGKGVTKRFFRDFSPDDTFIVIQAHWQRGEGEYDLIEAIQNEPRLKILMFQRDIYNLSYGERRLDMVVFEFA